MNRSFNIISSAIFFIWLADNALLFGAIALLKNLDAPSWPGITAILRHLLYRSRSLRAFSDALPKGQGHVHQQASRWLVAQPCYWDCIHLAYGFVGIGAAMQLPPAKYGTAPH